MKPVTARIHALVSAWVLCASAGGALGIKVKFGTRDGPIVAPTPAPRVVPVPPFRLPAPVWEERAGDLPDPNADWRPLFVPSTRYTQVNFLPLPQRPAAAPAQSSAQRFVSAYVPKQPAPSPPSPASAQHNQPDQTPRSQQVSQLSSQSVPGVGIRYFIPVYRPTPAPKPRPEQRQEDAHLNSIDEQDAPEAQGASAHDAQLHYEKESTRRARHSLEGSHNVVYYQWPVYTPYSHQ